MAEYIIEFQAFRRGRNLLQLKELAIIDVEGGKFSKICLFQAPCNWSRLLSAEKKTNRFLELKFHGIPWNYGSIPLKYHVKILQDTLKDASKIYTKGLEKKRFLEIILPDK